MQVDCKVDKVIFLKKTVEDEEIVNIYNGWKAGDKKSDVEIEWPEI